MATSLNLGYNSVVKIAETSQFAMRHIFRLFLILPLLLLTPAWAQDQSATLYEIPDVGIDVTAKSAAKARDQAVIEAQHRAFDELMVRLGVKDTFAQSMTDDDIAPLVLNFEVENERTSSVRYLGIFLVRFKPSAVRNLLANTHIAFSETRSRPMVVLPVYTGGEQPVLFEDMSKWRSAWMQSPADNGVVPIIVPQGGIDDLSLVTTKDAVERRGSALKAIVEKYQAVGIVIATLKSNPQIAKDQLLVDLERFDIDGNPQILEHASIKVPEAKVTLTQSMTQLVRKIREQLDKDYRLDTKEPTDAILSVSGGNPTTPDPIPPSFTPTPEEVKLPANPTTHLTVSMATHSLTDWSDAKKKLDQVPSVVKANVVGLARNQTNIDLEFQGTTKDLQQDINRQGLSLTPDVSTGSWTLESAQPHPL